MGQSGLTKGRGIFIGGILVVVALIGYVALDGYPPKDGDSAGAIGVADRYRAEQITEDDVQLTDAQIQYWLQNDDVQKLLSDPAFQKAAKDGNFAGIMENEYAREIFLDAEWASLWLDDEYATRLEEVNYAGLNPKDKLAAIRKIADEVALLGPDPRMPEFATDAEFAKMFEVNQAARALLDVEFLREAIEVMEEYGDAKWNGKRPEVALASLQALAKDADFNRDYRKVVDAVNDAELAGMFKEVNYLSKIFMDLEYARKLYKVALAARDRIDVDFMRPRYEVSYAGWMRAANVALVANPRLPDWSVDNEFASMFEDKAIGQIFMDVELLGQILDPELRNRISEVDFANMHPEAAMVELKQWFAEDAALRARVPSVEKLVLDADFAKRYELKYMKKLFTDFDYAKRIYDAVAYAGRQMEVFQNGRRMEVNQNGRRMEVNQNGRRMEADYATLLQRLEVNQASPWSLKEMVSDAEFQKLFLENELARALPVDVAYMKIVADVDAGYLIQRDRVEAAAMDAELMRRVIDDVEFAGRRRVVE